MHRGNPEKEMVCSDEVVVNPNLNDEQDGDLSAAEIDVEQTDRMIAYRQALSYYEKFGALFGTKVAYDWKPMNYVGFWFTNLVLSSAWFCMIYTLVLHWINADYIKILEPLAIMGVTSSVGK